MSGYIGTKAVTLSTTAANVGGDSTVGGDLTVDTNTLYVDSANNNVGVGVSSPSYPMTIASASNAVGLAINGRSADGLGAAYWFANNGTTQHGDIRASASEFRISSTPASAVQTFYTNGSERLRILSSGGITFNGDTAAANALDDYEEGTYTVNVTDASGNTSSSSFTGYYTKIGNLVEVNFYAPNISTVGLVSSDNIHFSLPFAVLANNYAIGSCVADTMNFSSGRTQINPRASATVDYIILRGTGSNITDDGVLVSELTSTVSDIFLSITYRTS